MRMCYFIEILVFDQMFKIVYGNNFLMEEMKIIETWEYKLRMTRYVYTYICRFRIPLSMHSFNTTYYTTSVKDIPQNFVI